MMVPFTPGAAARTSSAAPELPAITETPPGFDAAQWQVVVGPGGLPEPVVARRNAAIRAALTAPEVRARLHDEGADHASATSAEFAPFIQLEMQRWAARSGAPA